MHIILCIDDTDNIDSRGTGELASLIAREIEEKSWGKCSVITRHQLFIHPDVPYTSHNSSMCFEADINETYLDQVINYASEFLKKESAEGSDPGLCVVVLDKILESELFLEFGRKTKRELVSKQEAYDLANKLGIHLSEHGGTGQGIIGALAGAGLRLSKNDGRVKGKIKLKSESGMESVAYIKSNTSIEIVKDIEGNELKDEEMVTLEGALKAVYLDGKVTLLVVSQHDETTHGLVWKNCTKQQLSVY